MSRNNIRRKYLMVFLKIGSNIITQIKFKTIYKYLRVLIGYYNPIKKLQKYLYCSYFNWRTYLLKSIIFLTSFMDWLFQAIGYDRSLMPSLGTADPCYFVLQFTHLLISFYINCCGTTKVLGLIRPYPQQHLQVQRAHVN